MELLGGRDGHRFDVLLGDVACDHAGANHFKPRSSRREQTIDANG
jgi:uncharacterized protein YjlB